MAIKTRQTTATGVTNNNAPLTNAEVDNNFVELQQNKVDASGDTMTGDLSFGDNDKAIFGAGSDLQIYHDAATGNSHITESGSANMVIRGNDIYIQNEAGTQSHIVAANDASVSLGYAGGTKMSTTSTGIDVSGTVTADEVSLGDGEKIKLGASDDLQIYHDGDNSYIEDAGTGNLKLLGNQLRLKNSPETANYLQANSGAEVKIYYDGDQKFATSSTGVDITGEVKADKFTNDEALPTVRPTLLMDFQNSKTLDPRVGFTRAGSGTYWDGKSFAKAEENSAVYSNSWTDAWNVTNADATLTANAASAPDGTTTAVEFAEGTAATTHYLNYSFTPPDHVMGGARYASNRNTIISFYAKRASGASTRGLTLYVDTSGTASHISFDLVNLKTYYQTEATWGDRIDIGGIISAGNGWYRCYASYKKHVDDSYGVHPELWSMSDLGSEASWTHTGSGNAEFYFWGFQLENREDIDYPSALTVTTSSPVVKYQPVMKTAGSGEPRFDHNPATGESRGLMVEPTMSNFIVYSEDFTKSNWTKTNVVLHANTVLAPDGTFTASEIVSTGTNAGHRLTYATGTYGSGHVVGFFIKAGTSRYAQVYTDYVNTDYANFDLQDGVVTATGSTATAFMQDCGNGWYRCSIRTGSSSSGNIVVTIINSGTAARAQSHTDETSLYVWGASREVGNFPTSYIKTNGSSATRGEDKLLCSEEGFDFFNNAEGTILAKYEKAEIYPSDSRFFAFTDRADTYSVNALLIRGNDQPAADMFVVYAYNSGQGGPSVSNSDLEVSVAGSYAVNSIRLAVNGAAGGEDTSMSIPHGINQFYVSANNNMAFWWKKIAYYPEQFSTATLQAMTEE